MRRDPFIQPDLEAERPESRSGPTGLTARYALMRRPDPVIGPAWVHVHARIEVGVVLDGEHMISFADHTLACRRGDVWLCNSWEPHGFCSTLPNTSIVLLRFLPELLGEELLGAEVPWLTLFAMPPEERPRVSTPALRRRVLEIAETMAREMNERQTHWDSMVRLELLRLLTELHRHWTAPLAAAGRGQVRAKGMIRIMPALRLIHSLPWRRVSAVEAARACSLGVSTFHEVFHRTTGMSFSQFGLRARLSSAAHSLLNTDRTIATIALESGFADDSHFRRFFRRQYKCTPLQYRKRHGREA